MTPVKTKKTKKAFHVFGLELYIMWFACAAVTMMVFFVDQNLFLWLASFSALAIGVSLVLYFEFRRNTMSMLGKIAQGIDPKNRELLLRFPLPVLIAGEDQVVVWHNNRFKNEVSGGADFIGKSLKKVMPDIIFGSGATGFEGEVHYNDKVYTVIGSYNAEENGRLYSYYFIDETKNKEIEETFLKSRPCVAIFMVDNLEELLENEKDSEKVKVSGAVESALEGFMKETNGVMIRTRRDRYIAIVEEQHLKKIIENKFAVLEAIKSLVSAMNIPITFSIGIGRGAPNLQTGEQMARQALDMAIGRGGDQAVIKTSGGYDFFGGISQTVEKHTKGKARIVSAAILEFLEVCSNVVVMGHKNSDLDCLGSAIGLAVAIRKLGKPVNIVMDKKKNLSGPLLKKMMNSEEFADLVIEPEDADDLIKKDTLLIVVDTHSKSLLESEGVYEEAKSIIVIDHHRKLVNHIDNAVLFYHEPYASSTSEMVTELVQYFGDKYTMGRFEAEALLAGIMLDTKNFVIKTGVRTFEAAAYLRRRGADTVEVRKLFLSSMTAYQTKAILVASAQIYKRCAIAVAEGVGDELKVIVPQAADELLTISGVDASFVIYETANKVNISARSMGIVNVQIIMENLGGGGHHTMAGTQIEGDTAANVKSKLQQEIDRYFSSTVL